MGNDVVLITGASGFIGSNMADYLYNRGYKIVALDINKPVFGQGKYCTVCGDIRDEQLLARIFEQKIDYVIHLAAVSTIQMGEKDRVKTIDVNVNGTKAILNAVKNAGNVKGVLYASTDKVYGSLSGNAYTEDDPIQPLNLAYDSSKADADIMVRRWAGEYGIPAIVFRFCNIYGRYDIHSSRIIPGTIRSILEDRSCLLRLYRDSVGHIKNYCRDFLYAEDLCEVFLETILKMEEWNAGRGMPMWGEAFNLGSIKSMLMDELIWNIQNIIGKDIELKLELSESFPEIHRQCMNYTKAKKYLDFSPVTTITEGLEKTIRWWKEYLGKDV